MKKQNIDIFVLIVMSVVLFGCKQEQKTGQQEVAEEEAECEVVNRVGIYALPGDYEVDYPKDLVAYFDSLCVMHKGRVNSIQQLRFEMHWKS